MNQQASPPDTVHADKRRPPARRSRWRSLIPVRAWREPHPVVTVLRLSGLIGGPSALRRGLSLAGLASTIERAFAPRHLAAVALVINSPGGSPVQSRLIHARIRAMAEEKGVPVLAFVEDAAASGGYWLALAGDEIFADESSIVGSIGVVSSSFGFTDLIGRAGIERRLYTAGSRKSLLDPFQPERPEEVERLKRIMTEMHEAFIAAVRERRAGKIAGDDESLFSGEFWTGRTALRLGLIDALGEIRTTIRARFGERVRFRAMEPRRSWAFRLGRAPASSPEEWIEHAFGAIEERAAWTRLGL